MLFYLKFSIQYNSHFYRYQYMKANNLFIYYLIILIIVLKFNSKYSVY